MPIHRRKIYFDYSLSRKRRTEEWFTYSIYLATAILMFSLLGSWRDMTSRFLVWSLPSEISARLGLLTEATQLLTMLCEALALISTAYLALALFVKSHSR